MADNIHEIDEFGDLPPLLLNRLSQILSKRRVINSRTLNLFLRPEFDSIDIYDCASELIELLSIRILLICRRVGGCRLHKVVLHSAKRPEA